MLRSVFLEFSHLSMVQLCRDSSLCIDIRLQLYLDLQTQVKTVLHPQYDQHNQTIFHETPLNMSRYRKAVASALWLQLALVACYKPLGVVEALFTQSGQPSLVFFVRQLTGILVSRSVIHTDRALLWILHTLLGGFILQIRLVQCSSMPRLCCCSLIC